MTNTSSSVFRRKSKWQYRMENEQKTDICKLWKSRFQENISDTLESEKRFSGYGVDYLTWDTQWQYATSI